MSAIDNLNGTPSSKKRCNRNSTRVDLTPMVDLGFLLITFFVFTTQLSQPTAMHLNLPFDKTKINDNIVDSNVLTLVLKEDNAILYYEGMPESNPEVRQTSFGPYGIRDIILSKKKKVQQISGQPDDFVLIIKAADRSTFQNFVDIVDEVTINNIKHYYIDEISTADKKLLVQN